MQIRFGTLDDVFGRPATSGGFVFLPAAVELEGDDVSDEFLMRDAVGPQPPAILIRPLEQQYDAAWVRARLPQVFGYTPIPAEVEKSLLDVGFVAVPSGSEVGIPFICSDYYGRTGLVFSELGPEPDVQAAIAAAFWQLLLSAPEDVADFESAVYHPGAGVWMQFGCSHGDITCSESEDEQPPDDLA